MHQSNGVRFATTRLSTGLRVHYAEQGDREGEAIVFLHAYVDSWFSYGRVLSLLSPAYHAYAPDQRGHGDSDKPVCCYTANDYAADIDAFMEAVDIEEATLVGDSSGGLIAQRVALDYPARVGRLVLIGAPTTLVNNEIVRELGEETLSRLEDPVSAEFAREFVLGTFDQPVPEEFLERAVSQSLKVPARVWREYWEGVALAVDDTSRLGEIVAPTLILWGEQDALLPREEQERRAAVIPDATLVVYPDTGHLAHWVRPEWIVRDLEAFIEDTRPAT
jgi:pimeloyl-ACP methyl ester carboxylesterase